MNSKEISGTSLVVQWLLLCAFTAKGTSPGTEIPQETLHDQKTKPKQGTVLRSLFLYNQRAAWHFCQAARSMRGNSRKVF